MLPEKYISCDLVSGVVTLAVDVNVFGGSQMLRHMIPDKPFNPDELERKVREFGETHNMQSFIMRGVNDVREDNEASTD